MKAIYHYITGLCALLLIGCNNDELSVVNDEDSEIMVGEQIQFTSMLPDDLNATRAPKDEWETKVRKYSPVNHDYSFAVTMWKKNAENGSTLSGTSTYKPMQTTDIGSSTISGYDGTLKLAEGATALYWQDNVNKWGFTAEANNNTLESDQSTQEKWLAMDHLMGHSYLPVWDDDKGTGTDLDTPMYMTSKEWYKANQTASSQSGSMVSAEDCKKIPLYMKHQRAWITVILKAGEGVTREALAFDKSADNIRMAINSYTMTQSNYNIQAVSQPWASEYFIDYEKDANGEAASKVSTTRYDAIVEPHNYGGGRKDEDVIAKINLSNQNFSFYASNDTRYYVNSTEKEKQEADAAYNLEAGKHLTITVTLSRESRKILITAWIEDWTEVVTSTICDDYGQNGDPIVIKNREELIAFLTDPKKNSQGSVGIIQPLEIDLDPSEDPVWSSDDYTLSATLNLAGSTLKTSHRLFKRMTSSANLVNGKVMIKDGTENLQCAIALGNDGTIERVNVVTSGEDSQVKASLAGLVGINRGTIYQCSSTLPVYGTEAFNVNISETESYSLKFVGGIAAASATTANTLMSVIDGCTVNASVNGTEGIGGGGIVGCALGRVTNNTFEYGITVKQDQTKFKNIVGDVAGLSATVDKNLRAYGNAWPTLATNDFSAVAVVNPNNYPGTKFNAVIDCQDELDCVMGSTYNVEDKNYRISKSFTVSSDNWTHGDVSDDAASQNNVKFNLDGNDKTITLTGTKTVKTTNGTNSSEGDVTTYTTAPMLFNYVLGEIKDLTLYLEKSIVAQPSVSKAGEYNATDAIAPLAYAVYGTKAKLSNIKVKAHKGSNGKNDVYVQAATPAGLVVWAFADASITNCKVQVPVKMWLPSTAGEQAKHYAGGIVACTARASVTESVYLVQSDDAMSSANNNAKGANHYYGGIVGGTAPKDSENPSLQIADCTSWFSATREAGNGSRGSIIGYTCYATSGSNSLLNGMNTAKKSEGNWWPLDKVGAYQWADGMSEEQVIGKRNSVTPTYDDSDL